MSTNLLFNKLRQSVTLRTSRIPKDRLRPEYTFGPIIQKFVDARAQAMEGKEATQEDIKTFESVDKSLAMLSSNGWKNKVRSSFGHLRRRNGRRWRADLALLFVRSRALAVILTEVQKMLCLRADILSCSSSPTCSPYPPSLFHRNQYPATERTLRPKSLPIYYYRLVDATDRANRGEKKPYWRIFFSLEADGLEERVARGELDERIGLPRRQVSQEA